MKEKSYQGFGNSPSVAKGLYILNRKSFVDTIGNFYSPLEGFWYLILP